jgi:hypothetical protein
MRKTLYAFFILLSICWIGCEKVAEDVEPTIDNSTASTGRVFYTFQNTTAAIDPAALLTTSDIKQVDILDTPTFGTISFNNKGLLLYTPNENILEATEQLSLASIKQNGDTITSNITIKIVKEDFILPCINIAMGDRVRMNSDETTIIDVLKNDIICDGTLVQVAILDQPQNGSITKDADNKIIYKPNGGFKGNDRFLYEIEIENAGKKQKKVAFCQIQVVDNICKTMLKPDVIFLKQQNFFDSIRIFVLSNDDLCPNDMTNGKLEIKNLPKKGTIRVLQNKSIVYQINPSTISGPLVNIRDSFEYNFTTALGSTLSEKVIVLSSPSGCKLEALEDLIIIDKDSLVGLNFIMLDVLLNDVLCNFQLKDINIRILPNGTVWFNNLNVTPDKKIRMQLPNGGLPPQIIFNYQLIDNKGKETFPAPVKIKFVD